MVSKARKDVFLDQWVYAKGDALKVVVAATVKGILQYEVLNQVRTRKRKPKDQESFVRQVELVVTNVARVAVSDASDTEIAYPRDKSLKPSRYDNRDVYTKTFPIVVDAMTSLGLLETTTGSHGAGRSTFRPTEAFLTEFEGATSDDVGRSEGDELIILKRRRHLQGHSGDWFRPEAGKRVGYTDTQTTLAYRAEMLAINGHLVAADLSFIDDGQLPKVDTSARTLRRYFAEAGNEHDGSFNKGGRLFGGWWLNLPRERRSGIRIEGERCALLDYASMFARLAYARQGLEAPSGDLYDMSGLINGFGSSGPHRDGIKKVFNALMFGGATKDRYPRNTKTLMPRGCRVADARAAIGRKHPALSSMFGTLVGYDLMMDESRILVALLKSLNAKGIVALPLHDGVLTAEREAKPTRSLMQKIAKEVCGCSIPVTLKEVA